MVINRGHESMTMSGKSCGVAVGDLPEEDMDRVYYYAIFPNMLLSLHPDYIMFHTLWPKSGPHPDLLQLALPPRHPRRPDVPAGRRGGVLGHDQPAGLAHLRAEPARGQSRAYVPGPTRKRESLSVQFDREVLRSLGRAP
jgi:Rieske 2Fe-2S family protein